MYLDNFNQQHKDIKGLVATIQQYKFTQEVESHAGDIARALAKLAGLLSIHLAAEDKYLYPSLQKSEDQAVRDCATTFAKEMGGLAENFTSYKESYSTATKIKGAIDGFLTDTKVIMEALSCRLQKEEQELYPLIE